MAQDSRRIFHLFGVTGDDTIHDSPVLLILYTRSIIFVLTIITPKTMTYQISTWLHAYAAVRRIGAGVCLCVCVCVVIMNRSFYSSDI